MRVEHISDTVESTGCQDMALLPNGALEGPISITCDIPESVGKLTKCCPRGHILDSTMKNCVPISENGPFLPNRMVRDPLTLMATGHYHLEIFKQENVCESSQIPVFE